MAMQPTAEVTLWRDIFVKFDADHSGEYDTSEGKKLLSAIGIVIHDRSMNVKYFASPRRREGGTSRSISDHPQHGADPP